MNRTVRRSAQCSAQWSLVIALTVLLGGSPASAGWLRHKMKQHCCKPAISCSVVAKPACPSPAPSFNPEPACCPAPAAVSCAPAVSMVAPSIPCCDYSSVPPCCSDSGAMAAPVDMNPSYDMGMPVEMGTPMDMGSPVEMPMEGTIVDDAMMAVPMTDNVEQSYDQNVEQGTVIESSSPAPIEETVEQPEQPFDSAAETAPPVPSEPESTAAEPVADPTTDSDDDDLFGGSSDDMSADPVPADEPADDMNTDDLFGGSDDPAPTQPSDSFDDDLFGGPSDGAPVEAEGSMDDLFGSPPADAPAEEPAGGMDDLFGDPPADTNDAMPNSDEQPSIDDLFGDASSQNDSDIESMVSQETSVDDLFGTAESTEVTSDELFDAPSQDASQDTDADFNIDDLFGATTPPSVKVTEESPVAVEEAAVQVVSKSVMPTDVLGENRIRTWIDNTGVYHVEGRLIEIAGDHVRLLKANGRTCTVPNSRLCQADAAYVDSIREQADSSRLAMLTSK